MTDSPKKPHSKYFIVFFTVNFFSNLEDETKQVVGTDDDGHANRKA